MSVKVIGTHSKPHRIVTGLHTLDRAFTNRDGDIGVPIGVGYEIFGLNYTGKSTFCYSLAAIIANAVEGDIALCDFEGFDDVFLANVAEHQGFSGKVYVVSEEQDEDQLDGLIDHLNKKCVVGILDSIGAIAPMGETRGDIGESNMGKRAFLMAQFSRKALKLFRFKKDKTVLMVNHWYPKLGGYGYDTPGGEAKKYIASVRIKLSRNGKPFPDGSYALIGEVIKNRWGYQNLQFHIFMLSGCGLSAPMTAVWDCCALKLVKRGKAGLTHEGENLGKLGHLARAAREGKLEVFQPFYQLLEGYHAEDVEDSEDDGDPTDDKPKGETDSVVDD